MWSEAYNDWLAGDEPEQANYDPADWEMYQSILNGEEPEF